MAKQVTDHPLLLGAKETSNRTGLAEQTIRNMFYSGQLPAFRIGKRWVISVAALEAWITDQTNRATGM